jgi:multiple antibiotic resistance protein
MIEVTEYAKLLIALLAIVDIPGNVPLFLQQTARFSTTDRLTVSLTTGVTAGAILLAFAFFGEAVLATFGITIAAFRILGGIVILLIALDMLGFVGSEDPSSQPFGGDDNSTPVAVGIFPLAVPLFAGPGAIATVMVYAHEDFHSDHDLIVGAVIVTAAVAIIIGLVAASFVGRFVGSLAQKVLNRLLGMIVGSLGIEFIIEGIADFFPGLTTAVTAG